jgi:prepilin-type N-terminal cleavage/methylation domain-containing protein
MVSVLRPRSGLTLVELSVVLALGGIVLALVVTVGARLERQFGSLSAQIAESAQLDEAAAILPIDLRALSPVAGDIRTGEASDTTLEVRATIASGIVCSATPESLVVAPALRVDGVPAGKPVQAGDTLWVFVAGDSGVAWRPLLAQGVHTAAVGCTAFAGSSAIFGLDARSLRVVQREGLTALPLTAGAPYRVTRPARFSFYRASDGHWYLGLREWNTTSARFNQVQPVSGPYLAPSAPPRRGTRFVYFDSLGAAMPPGSLETDRIALVGALLHSAAAPPGRAQQHDSAVVLVAPRNRR